VSEPLRSEVRGHVLLLTLDRPAVRNAIDPALAGALARAADRLDDDPGLRVAVLAGDARAFCAGTNLRAAARGERVSVDGRGHYGILGRPPGVPLIAAVEGFALGGGLELTLGCDLVVAGEGATFGLPEVRRGLLPDAGALFRLPRRIGRGRALRLGLTGRPIDAATAAEWGLVDELVPAGEAVDRALALAEEIAANAPLAVAQTLAGLRRGGALDDAAGWAMTAELRAPILASEDLREGIAAFTEKREPRWTGR
jgi:enoyl-CoA hydratase/carnithine racemase